MLRTSEEIKSEIATRETELAEIKKKARAEQREYSPEETRSMVELGYKLADLRGEVPRAMTLQNGPLGSPDIRRGSGGYELRSPGQAKDYRTLYGTRDEFDWPDKDCGFFQAVLSGRHHPGLTTRAMTVAVGSDGGFLVPSQTAAQIHAVSLENELVMPLAFVQPMVTNELKIPCMAIGSHASSLMGGFTASFVAEAGSISEANPKTRSLTLQAKKLTGLLRFSAELAQDIPGGESQLITICGKGLSFYKDKSYLKGSGHGEPLGILNAPCLVSVAKESGQKAGTIIYENLTKMLARLYPGSFKNSVWICHQSTIPQLLTLSLSVGLGGNAIPVMSETNGKFSMLTRPVYFTEKTETLGTKGDILLCDLSQYVVGLRSEMRFDLSISVHFSTDEILARLITRIDGMPLWNEALTLLDGATTVSPYVRLNP